MAIKKPIEYYEDLINKQIGRLIVLELDHYRNEQEIQRKEKGEIKNNKIYYVCQCECGNFKTVSRTELQNKKDLSCGCLTREKIKKYNRYIFLEDYGICFLADTNKEVLFDLEDYDKIKNIFWKTDECGYARGYDTITKRYVRMHKIITDTDQYTIIDHINRIKTDNRKKNFRYATKSQNRLNSKNRTNNTSGIQGVRYEQGKWRARITIDGKYKHLGMFEDFDDAVYARLQAEKKYYKEFAMQKHLFKQYGIN